MMLTQMLALLAQAQIAYIDGSPALDKWDRAEATGQPDNQVVRFSWEQDGDLYEVKLTEEGLAQATFNAEEGVFEIPDHEGEPTKLFLATLIPLTLVEAA